MAMARRRATKARSKSAPAGARPSREKAAVGKVSSLSGSGGTLQERLAALERERDQLREELERSRASQRQLEETQAQVRDRLTWALDSLQHILQGKS
jgi:hypothetical protein